MLWECGQIVNGVQEYCDACWKCSSQCSTCGEWFNKEHVGPQGLCVECEHEHMHRMVCQDCDHEWKVYGFSVRCPHCEYFHIVVGGFDDLFYQDLVEEKQIEYIKKLQAEPLKSMHVMEQLKRKKKKKYASPDDSRRLQPVEH